MRTADYIVKRITLERFLVNAMLQVHVDALEPTVDVRLAHACHAMLVRLQAYVWAEDIQQDTSTLTVEWPASVWQAFKDRWFPRWALRRWPVKLASRSVHVKFTVKAKLPGYKYVAPRGERYALHASVDLPSFRFRGNKPESEE